MPTPTEARRRFRSTHPARHVELMGQGWEYFAGGHGSRGLLMLGGALSFGDTSHRLFNLFESTRKVISPTYPNVGSVADLVDALPRLLDAEGLSQVDVFGHGLGAGLAHLLVRRYPERVQRLTLAGFGLTTPFRVAATRSMIEMFELMPHGTKQHFQRIFQRHAEAAGDLARASELLEAAHDLLERHSRASALHHLRLQANLFKGHDDWGMARPVSARALLLFANDDACNTRQEQDNLARTYPEAIVVRHLNAGRMIGLVTSQEVEKKLELFFRLEPTKAPVSATPAVSEPFVPTRMSA